MVGGLARRRQQTLGSVHLFHSSGSLISNSQGCRQNDEASEDGPDPAANVVERAQRDREIFIAPSIVDFTESVHEARRKGTSGRGSSGRCGGSVLGDGATSATTTAGAGRLLENIVVQLLDLMGHFFVLVSVPIKNQRK